MANPQYTKLPPGPDEVRFQEYCFDEYLGAAPGSTKGLDLSNQVMGSDQCLTNIVCKELEGAWKFLVEDNKNEK